MTRSHEILRIILDTYGGPGPLPLHAPVFVGNERAYVQSTIDSTFVSSVGAYVEQFEHMLVEYTKAKYVIATTNGTTALHMALLLTGVQPGDLVITQSLSFVATANAVAHAAAVPAFIDVEIDTLGMSPDALQEFLERECERTDSGVRHLASGRRVSACVPMHSFGFPCRINDIDNICTRWGLALVEDAAEALGSWRDTQHCGTTGRLGTLSFNGNKICTTGGGGAIMTNDASIAKRARHLTTTAKIPHRWRFKHDEIGYNFRLPNLNAALGCAQLEQLDGFLAFKRSLAQRYSAAFTTAGIPFVLEPENTRANYWLCAIFLNDEQERDACLEITNDAGVMTRPIWEPLHTLPMFERNPRGPLHVTEHVSARLVNIPSGVHTKEPV